MYKNLNTKILIALIVLAVCVFSIRVVDAAELLSNQLQVAYLSNESATKTDS